MSGQQQKEIASPPRVTAVVVKAGAFEATIGDSRIAIAKVGVRGGRTKLFDLDAADAQRLLELVAHGHETLAQMARKP